MPGGKLSLLADEIVEWDLPRLDGVNFHSRKPGSFNHHLKFLLILLVSPRESLKYLHYFHSFRIINNYICHKILFDLLSKVFFYIAITTTTPTPPTTPTTPTTSTTSTTTTHPPPPPPPPPPPWYWWHGHSKGNCNGALALSKILRQIGCSNSCGVMLKYLRLRGCRLVSPVEVTCLTGIAGCSALSPEFRIITPNSSNSDVSLMLQSWTRQSPRSGLWWRACAAPNQEPILLNVG